MVEKSSARRRRTIASAVLVGAPILLTGLLAGPAQADPVEQPPAAEPVESGHQLEFTGGGIGLLACDSKPSTTRLTVPAESTLLVVNRIGQAATLRIDGAQSTRIKKGASQPVLIRRGPVEVALIPDCLLDVGSKATPARVDVTERPTAAPTTPPALSPGAPADSRTPGAAPADERRPDARPDGEREAGASPSPSGSTAPTRTSPATETGTDADADADAPLAGPAGDGPDAGKLAAEPVGAVDVPADNGSIGLLALIATISVVGVSAGAIRAIVAQRASPARAA